MAATRSTRLPEAEILIVEDTPISLQLLTELLERAGYAVRQAQDGEMALATIRACPPDLVLLDIAMPGIDGFEVCRRLKAAPGLSNVPVIFCSAFEDVEYKIRGFAAGAVDFISKPYQPEEVLVRVRTHLELHRLRSSLERRVAERTAELEETATALRGEVAARRRAEEELRLSAKTFEVSYGGVMVTDRDGVILAVNPAFSRITGYSAEEAVGATPKLLESGRHDVDFYRDMRQALDERGTWTGEIWNRRKDGSVVPMMETICEFREESGQVSHYVSTLADLSESRDAQTLIDFLAYRDGLTGVANRLAARSLFERAVVDAERLGTRSAILCLDLDRFKVINDSLGYPMGDQLLKMVAATLSGCLGEDHLLAREGGDEFMVVVPNMTRDDEAVRLAGSIVAALNRTFELGQTELTVTTSLGLAVWPDDGATFDELLTAAENALHQSKKEGGNFFCRFTRDMDSDARRRMEIESHLRSATANDELKLVFQPKVEVATGRVVGAEALVRWNSPALGFVSPGDFIPLAEETGLILGIDEWVLTAACRQIRAWRDAGVDVGKVSVNLSTLQFRRGDLNMLIRRVLLETGVSASSLDLEITEGVLMHNIQSAVPILTELKKIGVSISLDDFGTGYSSLNYLKRLPIDTLKIDKSFVDGIHLDSNDAVIARAVIALGRNLGLKVVAEGVEHREQYEFLQAHGCDEIQGYYFSKPLPADQFVQWCHGRET